MSADDVVANDPDNPISRIANARDLYEAYAAAMAYVAVSTSDGSERIGSAFHVGEGVFVTARHVVEEMTIKEVGTFASKYVRLTGEAAEQSRLTVKRGEDEYKAHRVDPAILEVVRGPFYHPDSDVDVACFKVADLDPYTPVVPLGDHLDDWLGRDDFVLSEVVVLGFPPIPFVNGPHLVAARGEVNALIDPRHTKHIHFVISTMPRGGFSGGVVLAQSGIVLGLVTESLLADYQPEQLGYMAVLTVEPIYVCLAEHKLLPQIQAAAWDDFWNVERISFVVSEGLVEVVVASIEYCDDGHKCFVEVLADRTDVRDSALAAAELVLQELDPAKSGSANGSIRLTVNLSSEQVGTALIRAANAAIHVFENAGYTRSAHSKQGDLQF
jgi:hypothetical protein